MGFKEALALILALSVGGSGKFSDSGIMSDGAVGWGLRPVVLAADLAEALPVLPVAVAVPTVLGKQPNNKAIERMTDKNGFNFFICFKPKLPCLCKLISFIC
ncbi:hypothetical protein [Paenibacillus durus]|uniref:Uncharacterized protein n=1 Tax=Paenibacillus durus ATCC 35681 TaxID=1333534 RepID=A0A0F7F9B5_PAEDU|nr:hypothetical protein [Paenibacillus durus]AKG34397.1 hypothetical protein VK70_07265 [Paenibacillus durus ATCC 35681]